MREIIKEIKWEINDSNIINNNSDKNNDNNLTFQNLTIGVDYENERARKLLNTCIIFLTLLTFNIPGLVNQSTLKDKFHYTSIMVMFLHL